jgi:thiol-disulfide isomerase/thioredoxin
MKRFVGIILAAGLLGTLLLGCSSNTPEEKKEPPRTLTIEEFKAKHNTGIAQRPPASDQKIGAAAPKTESQDLSGKKVALSDLKGKVVALDFWGVWCPHCVNMIPHTQKLVAKMKGKPFEFVSLSSDPQKETVTKFLETTKMPWTHWWEGQGGPVARLWGVNGFPTVYVIDHKGIVRHKQEGNIPGNELDTVIENLVKAAEEENKVATK